MLLLTSIIWYSRNTSLRIDKFLITKINICYTNFEVLIMTKNAFLTWIEEGSITIPSFLFSYYKKIGLTDVECMMLLHIHQFIQKGIDFPTHEQLAERMILTSEQCSQIMGSLMHRGFLEIQKGSTENGIYFEKYTLKPLWERLMDYHLLQDIENQGEKHKEEEDSLYTIFEQEFGRPLSPMECESLAMWIDNDHHSPAIIKAALKEAVMSNKMNFRYIDRILFEWQKRGIQTVDEARAQGEKFRKAKQRPRQEELNKNESVPFYNWLEN